MMARSRSIDRLRSRRTRPEAQGSDDQHAMDEMPGSMPDAAASMLDEEQTRIVQRALGALPLIQRVAIELAYYDGLSHREIAERLEEPLGTVKTRIRLGLLKLRDALTEARI
jgi:RNA polymerase sigma-70 factor (ECF subfamily)